MAEDDFEMQLEMLQQLLGKKVTLREDDAEATTSDGIRNRSQIHDREDWENWQAKDSPFLDINCPSAGIVFADPGIHDEEEPKAGVAMNFFQLTAGETASEDVTFCPWKAIVAYPNMFIGKTNKPLARPFFDTILEDNKWDFYYLHDPRKPNQPPHLLVPTEQFEDFLGVINNELGICLTIPHGMNRQKFCILFSDGNLPRPRYLLHSSDEYSLERATLPGLCEIDIRKFTCATRAKRDDFCRSLSKLSQSTGSVDKKQKAEERSRQRTADREKMMVRTQTLLGLRPAPRSRGSVFVGMDLEALELAPQCVSEVGVAVLDAEEIHGILPGQCGANWWPFIQAHHLRIKEYSGSVNHRFFQGCPNAFNFGQSTFPRKHEVVHEILEILEPYTSQKRDLVFVAHDPKQDHKYLSYIGLDIERLPGMSGDIDTQALHQLWSDGGSPRSLRSVMSDVGMQWTNLHNAGNDAVYTVRAMTSLAVEQGRKEEAACRGQEYVPEYLTGFSVGD